MMAGFAGLQIKNLSRSGLGPIDLAVQAGECICLSGPSGSGKTLLLRAIADLDPHAGDLLLDGTDCTTMNPSEWRSQVGLLSAESYWWGATVGDHFPSNNSSFLQKLGFSSRVMQWEVERLSSGERQRLALLRLLANQPRVLLLDEPSANLDPENVQRMEALLTEYRQTQNAALLWVSHDQHQIQRVAQGHFRLDDGQLEVRALP